MIMFKLPELQFDFDALEPHIDAKTMEIHHGKHHAGYVKKLNAALEGKDEFLEMSVEDLLRNTNDVPQEIRQNVINNGGGHANHSLFWQILSPAGSDASQAGRPDGNLLEEINRTFGSFEDFKKQFSEKAGAVFGSGWAFLIVNNGKLEIKRQSFQNSPLMDGNTPILGLDVWEHAYYLNYQNRRADYINAFWNVVNWEKVSELYSKATS